MDALLVISEEPALAETLASELPDIAIAQTHLRDASLRLSEKEYRLVVVDESGDAVVPDTGKTPAIRLSRPVVLSELLYTIRERLQGKSAASREELTLSDGFRLSPSERLLRAVDGSIQITLTEKETELLQCLLEGGGETIPRDLLLKRVWGYSDDIATHTLETHIYRLRGKLRQANESIDILSSDEGGYQLKW